MGFAVQPSPLLIVLLLDPEPVYAEARGALVVATLSCGLLLVFELPDLHLQVLHAAGHALGVDALLAGGLVDEVHGLVGQQPLGDVALAESDGSFQGLVCELDLVVGLVLRAQAAEHLDRRLHVRFLDENRLEAALQGGVPLDVVAVFGFSGGAEGLKVAAREGGLHHVAGVDGALRGAGANDRVQLVYEQNYLALGLLDLIEDGLQPLLELASELAAGHQRAHVESQDPPFLQLFRDVARDDALCQALGYGGLADAGPSNEHGVVLGPPDQRLHGAGNLCVPADHGIELAIGRQLSQIDAVFLQGAVAAFRARVIDSVSPSDVLERLVELLQLDAELLDDGRGISLFLLDDRDEQVLGADEVVVEAV